MLSGFWVSPCLLAWLMMLFGVVFLGVVGLLVNWIVVASIFFVLFCWVLVFVGIRWMPWYLELMKDVAVCDIPWGVGERVLIRGFPNGLT